MSVQEWHPKPMNLQLLQTFHEKSARQPDMKEAKKMLENVMKDIQSKLQEKKCCVEVLYVGSAYDGLKVGRAECQNEFDIMIVIGKDLAKATSIPDLPATRAMLVSTDLTNDFIKVCLINDEYISPDKVLDKFYGHLTQIHDTTIKPLVNASKCTSVIRRHGPAIQLDVSTGDGKLFFSLDIVPTLTISGGSRNMLEYFVAKTEEGVSQNSWRRSFSIQEKNHFDDIDSKNGCCKKLVRIMKAIFRNESTLKILTSYHIKTAMMHLTDIKREKHLWTDSRLFERFVDYMNLLIEKLAVQNLPHYYIRSENLFKKINITTLRNVQSRLENIVAKEATFNKLVSG